MNDNKEYKNFKAGLFIGFVIGLGFGILVIII